MKKNPISPWNFWNDFGSFLFYQVVISLLAYGVRELVAAAGLSSSLLFVVALLVHIAAAAGMNQVNLHNLERPEGELPVSHLSTGLPNQ